MAGLHPFDFLDLGQNRLPFRMQVAANRNIAALVAHIEKAGLRPSVHRDLQAAADLWRSDPKNPPLSVLANPELQRPLPDRSTMAVLLYRSGEPVGCIVQRRIWVWNLVEDMRRLAFWFPGIDEPPEGYRCDVSLDSDLLQFREGAVVYSCCLYVRPDAQANFMRVAMARLSHALCAQHWGWNLLIGRARCAVAAKLAFRDWGATGVCNGVYLLGPGCDDHSGHPHYVAWMKRETLEEQLADTWYGQPGTSIDTPVEFRPARAARAAAPSAQLEDAAS